MKHKLSLLALCGSALCQVEAQPLKDRVLIVYNSNPSVIAASRGVAEYYQAKRSIPAANLCPVPFNQATEIQETEWLLRKQTIRACLNAVGPANILYIVLSYQVPFGFYGPGSTFTRYTGLDGYVADIWDRYSMNSFWAAPTGNHGYYSAAQSQGNIYPPLQSFSAYRATPRAQMIYSVWRLDGPKNTTLPDETAYVKAMIDKAFAVESAGGVNAATGVAYIDRRYGSNVPTMVTDTGFFRGDIDLRGAAGMFTRAGLTVTEEDVDLEIGGGAAVTTAPNAILYSGWYEYGTYNNVFTWRDGAVGFHLDSASAQNYRIAGATSWVPNAIRAGITVTSGSVTEPFLEGLAHPDVVFRDLLQGAPVGDAFLRGTPWLRWNTLYFGDPLYRPFPGGRAPFNGPLPAETSLQLAGTDIIGGGTVTATLRLATPAPPGGQVFDLSLSEPGVLTLPATVTVAGGQSSATFLVSSSAVTTATSRVIRVRSGAVQIAQNTLTSYPLLGGLGVSVPQIQGGNSLVGRVLCYERAPNGGAAVSLVSSHPAIVTVPPSVTVQFGASIADFPITTTAVGAATDVTLTATYAGATVTTILKVVP